MGDIMSNEQNTNLQVWDAVESTPTKYTKKVQQRGGFTSVDTTYLSKRATEQFGMFGKGWGFSKTEFDQSMIEFGIIIHNAEFFYVVDGERFTFPIHNAIEIYLDKNKTRIDADFAKKLETNTISKALSRLGFAADAYLGLFDNVDYVNSKRMTEEIEAAENQEEKVEAAQKDFIEWLNAQVATLGTIKDAQSIKLTANAIIRKIPAKVIPFNGNPAKARAMIEAKQAELLNKLEKGE